jgi:hypothetical protein
MEPRWEGRVGRTLGGFIVAASLLLGSSVVRAQEVPPAQPVDERCPPGWGQNRCLGGHYFLTPDFVDSALITTNVSVRVIGVHTHVPNLPFGLLGRLNLNQFQAAEGVELGVRVYDRVSVFGQLDSTLDTGTSIASIAIRGTDFLYGGGGGTTIKLAKIESSQTQISITANGLYHTGQLFNLLPTLDAITTAPVKSAEAVISGTAGALLSTPVNVVDFGGSVAVAQPIGPLFGLQSSLGVQVQRTALHPFSVTALEDPEVVAHLTSPQLGVAIDFDARTLGVPVATMAQYQLSLDTPAGQNARPENVIAFGVYYSGRTDLQVGIIGNTNLNTQPVIGRATDNSSSIESGIPVIFGGRLSFRYTW